jgi:hypothetical protein
MALANLDILPSGSPEGCRLCLIDSPQSYSAAHFSLQPTSGDGFAFRASPIPATLNAQATAGRHPYRRNTVHESGSDHRALTT